MFAIDTSSLVAFLSDQEGEDVEIVNQALEQRAALFPPVVLAEILSDPKLSDETIELCQSIPLLDLLPQFWERAGRLRAKVLKRKLKARLADTLIAQSCIDSNIPLITRESDFRHFVRIVGLLTLP